MSKKSIIIIVSLACVILVLLIFIVGHALSDGVSNSSSQKNYVYGNSQDGVYRIYDTDRKVQCFIYSNGDKGGISCLYKLELENMTFEDRDGVDFENK